MAGQEQRLATLVAARPDATLAELRDALGVRVVLSTIWRELRLLDFTVKKNSPRRGTAPPGCRRRAAAVASVAAPA